MVIAKLLILFLVAVAAAAPNFKKTNIKVADICDIEKCKAPDCRCFSTDIPGGLEPSKVPQFVFLTFDDAVKSDNYEFYKTAFYNKKNPDGCNIGATYFTSHEYTDYSKINDLYNHGHEIALHSLSHSALTTYWQNISREDLLLEFGGEKELISYFANIPLEAIKGMRLPFLQLSGDNSFEVMKELNLTYDCSWPTQEYVQPGLWPYTLDFATKQECPIGPCPQNSHPGIWEVPMLDWKDLSGTICSMVDACVHIPLEEDEIVDWIKSNFNRNYKGNKAPFGFYMHSSWFNLTQVHFNAYLKFIEYLQTLNDVFIVNIPTALDWVRNPVALDSKDWPKCPEVVPTSCPPKSCQLHKGQEERYMTVCTDCPANYPWLDNPLGQ